MSYYIQAVLFTVIVFMPLPLYFSWCKRLENRDLYRRHLEAYNKAFNVFLDSSIFSVFITEIAIMATSNDAYSRITGIQLIMLELIPGLCLCIIRNNRFVMHLVLQVVVWILSFITVGVAIFYNVSLHGTECFGSGLQFAPNIWVLMANLGVFALYIISTQEEESRVCMLFRWPFLGISSTALMWAWFVLYRGYPEARELPGRLLGH